MSLTLGLMALSCYIFSWKNDNFIYRINIFSSVFKKDWQKTTFLSNHYYIMQQLELFMLSLIAGKTLLETAKLVAIIAKTDFSEYLNHVIQKLSMGMPAKLAWNYKGNNKIIVNISKFIVETSQTGVSLVQNLADYHNQLQTQQIEKYKVIAQKATVKMAAPLGLAFLPAFLCLGVIPTIISLTTDMFANIQVIN